MDILDVGYIGGEAPVNTKEPGPNQGGKWEGIKSINGFRVEHLAVLKLTLGLKVEVGGEVSGLVVPAEEEDILGEAALEC